MNSTTKVASTTNLLRKLSAFPPFPIPSKRYPSLIAIPDPSYIKYSLGALSSTFTEISFFTIKLSFVPLNEIVYVPILFGVNVKVVDALLV